MPVCPLNEIIKLKILFEGKSVVLGTTTGIKRYHTNFALRSRNEGEGTSHSCCHSRGARNEKVTFCQHEHENTESLFARISQLKETGQNTCNKGIYNNNNNNNVNKNNSTIINITISKVNKMAQ